MKKVKINTNVRDKQTGDMLLSGQIIERPDSRAKQFVDRGVGEYVEDKKEEKKAEPKEEIKTKSKSKSKK